MHEPFAVEEVHRFRYLQEDIQTLVVLPLLREAALSHPVLQVLFPAELHLDVQVHLRKNGGQEGKERKERKAQGFKRSPCSAGCSDRRDKPTFGDCCTRWLGGVVGSARVSDVGRGGEEEGADSCCLVCDEEELFFPVSVLGLVGPEAESVSASASRREPESSKTMSKEEEVQSLGPRGEQSSKELGVSEMSASAWLSLSDIRLSCPGIGWMDKSLMSTPKPAAPLDSRERASAEASRAPRASPPCPEPGDAELDTGTLTDSASTWSRKLIGQFVVLKEGKGGVDDGRTGAP